MIPIKPVEQKRRKRSIFAKHAALNTAKHDPLWLGWDEAQIEKAQIEMGWQDVHLGPVLAAVGCSLVAEAVTTGSPVRYSRRQCWYAYFAQHTDEPLMSYRKVVPAMDQLMQQGWAGGVLGVYLGRGPSKQSIAWATPELIERLAPLLVLNHRRAPQPNDVLVLRDKHKREMPVPDTDETRRMRDDLGTLNAAYARHHWYLRGRELDIPTLRRIFNENMQRGGRGYHRGPSYQQLPHEERAQITIDVDGIRSPTVEADYPTLHIAMAYAQAGVSLPEGDAYDVDGFNRNREVKPALNTLLNVDTEEAALGVIGGSLLDGDWNRGRELINALQAKHPALVAHFGSDAGARFQRLDSDMAIAVALGVLRRTGRPPLIIHDSFVVARGDEEVLRTEMSLALAASMSTLSHQDTNVSYQDLHQPLDNVLHPSPSPHGEPPLLSRHEAEGSKGVAEAHTRPHTLGSPLLQRLMDNHS